MKSKDVTYPLTNKSQCDNVTLKFLSLNFCNGIKHKRLKCKDISFSNVGHLRFTIFTWHKMGIISLVQHDCVDESVLVQEKQTTVDNSVHRALLWFVILHKL